MASPQPDHSALWTPEFLASMRLETDPKADALVERMISESGPQEARKLFDILIGNVDVPLQNIPDYVKEFLTETAQLPEWADPEKILRGEKFFMTHGMSFCTFLFYKSLPTTYLLANGANVLTLTGRLARKPDDPKRFSRRLGETAQFLIDVMSPGGLEPGGKGVRTAQKIRLIHASIRHFLPKDQWNEAAWGKPVCQEDMALTLCSFSVVMVEGMEIFGVHHDQEEADALMHSWAVVGHIMGLDSRLLPDSYKNGQILMEKILQKEARASEEGKILTASLVDWAKELIPGKALDVSSSIMIRECIGEERAAMLGVVAPNGCLGVVIPKFMARMLGSAEKLEERGEPMEVILQKINRAMIKRIIKMMNKEKNVRFSISDEVLKAWKMGDLRDS